MKKEHWGKYWEHLEPQTYYSNTVFDWNATVHEQWAIEYFPEALPDKTEERLDAVRPIAKEAADSKTCFTHESTGSSGRNRRSLGSFAYWQL